MFVDLGKGTQTYNSFAAGPVLKPYATEVTLFMDCGRKSKEEVEGTQMKP